ncbi:hypothetical protein NXW94_13350 [Bacteroides ovatus]|nr:hypothetical protein [Bacteroides ovatus]
MNLTKEHSIQIKGVAILCMVLFHLFGFPERIPTSVQWMGMPIIKALQICVPIYLFYGRVWFAMYSSKGNSNMDEHWKTVEEIIPVFLVGSDTIYFCRLYCRILCP